MWLVVCEVSFEPGDLAGDDTKGFMRVTMWGPTGESLRERLAECLQSHGWHLISIEKVRRIDQDADYSDEIAEMIDRTRHNPDAIIVGRVFSYKVE